MQIGARPTKVLTRLPIWQKVEPLAHLERSHDFYGKASERSAAHPKAPWQLVPTNPYSSLISHLF